TMTFYLLAHEPAGPSSISKMFERRFAMLRTAYGRVLAWSLHHRPFVVVAFIVFVAGSLTMARLVGRDFFPTVDAGLIKLHVRTAPGTRIEETERQIAEVEREIRTVIPADETETMLDVIGAP